MCVRVCEKGGVSEKKEDARGVTAVPSVALGASEGRMAVLQLLIQPQRVAITTLPEGEEVLNNI